MKKIFLILKILLCATFLISSINIAMNNKLLAQVFIKGRISDINDYGINFVKIYFISDRVDSIYTNSNGEFTFSAVIGKSYIIRPFKNSPTTEKRFFIPQDTTIINIQKDIDNVNFKGFIFYRILCTILDEKNQSISNVKVEISGNKIEEKFTNSNGQIIFDTLSRGYYTIQPTSLIYQFSPEKFVFNDLTSDQIKTFRATKLPTYSISGYVKDENDSPIHNTTVSLTGVIQSTIYTDINGYYIFEDLPAGSYLLQLSKSNYIFSDNNKTVHISNSTTINFTGLRYYTISGYIKKDNQDPLANVTLTINGIKNYTILTNSNGYFFIDSLLSGPIKLTPSLYSHKFNPEFFEINEIKNNIENLNFTATKINLLSLKGKIIDVNGKGLKNVRVILNGQYSFETISANDGSFTFSEIEKGSYSISFYLDQYKFISQDTLIKLDEDLDNLIFVGSPFYSISGYVYSKEKEPLSNISILLNNNILSKETKTNQYGKYIFDSLDIDKYNIIVNQQGYISQPTKYIIDKLIKNKIDLDFTLKKYYRISGYIKDPQKNPLNTIALLVRSENQIQIYTNTDGYFLVDSIPEGELSIAPHSDGLSFWPEKINLILNQNIDTLSFYGYIIISGKTLTTKAQPYKGVQVFLTGKVNDSCYTSNDGTFTFSYLPQGKYTLRPKGNNLTFIPEYYRYDSLSKSRYDQNITVINYNYISGSVYNIKNNPLNKIKIKLINSDSTYTDIKGNYFFNDLINGIYYIKPQDSLYKFYPDYYSISINNEVKNNLDFLAKKIISISGKVLDIKNNPIKDVTILIKEDTLISTTTNSTGNYIFEKLEAGNYSLLFRKNGYYFNPQEIVLKNIDSSLIDLNIIGYYKISGFVIDSFYKPIKEVDVKLEGDFENNVLTNNNGFFEFNNLFNGNYKISFNKNGYNFKPPIRIYNNLSSSVEYDTIYSVRLPYVSCHTYDRKGRPIKDVMLVISGDSTIIQASNGESIIYLNKGYYTITPLKTGTKFKPEFTNINLSSTDSNSIYFLGYISIEGKVIDSLDNGKSNIDISLNGEISTTSKTDEHGNFIFDTLCAGNYIISPKQNAYIFNPENFILQNIDKSISNLRFTIKSNNLNETNNLLEKTFTNSLTSYPNPFNNSTKICFTIDKESYIDLSLYDITGRKIIDLLTKQFYKVGTYEILWDNKKSNFSSGVYYFLLHIHNKYFSKVLVHKVILLK